MPREYLFAYRVLGGEVYVRLGFSAAILHCKMSGGRLVCIAPSVGDFCLLSSSCIFEGGACSNDSRAALFYFARIRSRKRVRGY